MKKADTHQVVPLMGGRGKEEPYDMAAEHDHELNLESFDGNVKLEGVPFLSKCLSCVCIPFVPCLWCSCCYTLDPNEEAIILHFGKYTEKAADPGIKMSWYCGREVKKISTKQTSHDLPTVKVLDKGGNPLMVSAIIVYRITNSERATLGVENARGFIFNQATATLRKVISQYHYETMDDSPSLKTHLPLVAKDLKEAAQSQLAPAGATVMTFQVNEISYSPEIAAAMLKRQQANALVQARRTLVSGCTEIAFDAVDLLEKKGVKLSDADKAAIVNNILTVTCSEGSTVNNIPVGMPTQPQQPQHPHMF